MNREDFLSTKSGQVVQTPQGYWAFIPNQLPPQLTWSDHLVNLLSQADRSLGELAGLGRSLPNPHLLVRPFMRREAVLSSMIEGTRASISDLYAFEAAQLSFFEDTSDVREVHNHVRALIYGLERLADLPISLRLLCEIHAILLEGVRGEKWRPGEFRNSQNFIGSPGDTEFTARFVPPPVEEMQIALNDLERYLYQPSTLPQLIRLGLIHYQFETIHPFFDGNGRIGRLLIILLLCAWGILPQPLLYLSAYLQENRSQYYDHLLAVSQKGAWENWLSFFLIGIINQANDAVIRSKQLNDLRETYRSHFLETTRISAGLLQCVDYLFEQPIITVHQVEKTLNVNYRSAYRYVNQLTDESILEETTGYSRNRVYRANEILEAIAKPLEAASNDYRQIQRH